MKPGFNLQWLSRFVAVAAAAALPLAVSAQESKGPSEKDCRNVNFPSSEQRLVRACNARFNLCAAPPPAWTQIPQVMQVCQSIRREQQLQGAVGAPGNSNIVAPARQVTGAGVPSNSTSSLLQPKPGFGNPPPKP
jgi:hypothetical protein